MSHDHAHGEGHEHHGPTSFLTRYVFSIDHKVIGIQFMFVSLLFVILGGLLALGVRYQLAWPNQNVPYAKLLPRKMTNRAPEANLALWKLGGEVEAVGDLQVGGRVIKAGETGGDGPAVKLTGFPNGLAVTLRVGTQLRDAQTDLVTTLEAPVDGRIDLKWVMADYQYQKQSVLAEIGSPVLVAGGEGRPEREQELAGYEREFAGSGSKTTVESVVKLIPLSVRRSETVVALGCDGEAVEAKADQVNYFKEALTTDGYAQLFTMHASIMIFFVIIPMLVGGFGNFLVPLMIGARDMAFPRLNMLSFWLAAPAGLIMLISFWTIGGAAGGGWTMYPTLSEATYSSNIGTTLWIASVGLVGFSSIVGALNYITTIINMRAPGMAMFRMPLVVWSVLITSVLALFATPMLTAAMMMLLLDRTLGTHFFMPTHGGQPLMWQHIFWFYSHPAVYIMILPAMGVTSDVLATCARKPIFGYKPMVYAMAAITALGFIVWGHHMFQSGMNPVLGTTFMASTIMIAVPSAIKTFNWLGTLWGGNIRYTPAMLNALGFVSMFVIGGLSGIFMASAPVDIHIHDTYFIVAHIHYVLFGGSIFAIFAGIYHWFPKMFGRQLNQKWGVIHFVMTIIAFNGTFFLMHILGIGGHPRRYAAIMEYPTLEHLQPLNVFMTICAMMLGMAQLPFFYNVFASLPRALGRAVAAVFGVMLGLATVGGLSYWAAQEGGTNWLARWVAVQPEGGVWQYSQTGELLGYVGLAGGILVAGYLVFRYLPVGGKIGAAFVVLPAAFLAFKAVRMGGSLYDTEGKLFEGMEWAKMWHDVAVAAGHGLIYAGLVIVGVCVVWAVGGALRMPALLQRLLYVVFLPAFLSPMLLKKDPYMWLGIPDWYPDTCVKELMVLGLFALPGLAYLLMRRPKDEFGYEAGMNPWEANSLEWATSSPPPQLNFDEIPTVYRGPYEYSSPVVKEDFLPQVLRLPEGVVEPAGH